MIKFAQHQMNKKKLPARLNAFRWFSFLFSATSHIDDRFRTSEIKKEMRRVSFIVN